mgnify:CR=1 FL=1
MRLRIEAFLPQKNEKINEIRIGGDKIKFQLQFYNYTLSNLLKI